MKIAYILTSKTEDVSTETFTSIKKNKVEEKDIFTVVCDDDNEIEKVNEKIDSLEDTFTHVCIIPDGSILSDNYEKILSQYIKEDVEKVYLPLTSLYHDPEGKGDGFRGFLNSVIWKMQMTEVLGELTMRTAAKQIDTTLYGALIPLTVAKKYKLNPEIKYFSHFEYLNKIISEKVSVLGIPKMLFNLYRDYELKSVNREEKLKYFEEARKAYMPKPFSPEILNLNTEKK